MDNLRAVKRAYVKLPVDELQLSVDRSIHCTQAKEKVCSLVSLSLLFSAFEHLVDTGLGFVPELRSAVFEYDR